MKYYLSPANYWEVSYWEEATRAPSAVGKKESAAVASLTFLTALVA